MAWIRLSDDYMEHPKFDHLSDGAFRLWHKGMAFCRKYKTDGNLPLTAVRKFKAYSPKRARELTAPWLPGENPLWHVIDSFGFKVHDYLDWNLSKDEEGNERAGSAARMRKFRQHLSDSQDESCYGATEGATAPATSGVTNAFVPDMDRKGIGRSTTEDKKKGGRASLQRTRFDAFWQRYPRKVGKDAAWRAWLKRQPDAELSSAMLTALDWQTRQDAWTRDGGQFVPNPATWLNQGRWQDEPPALGGATLALGKQTTRLLAALETLDG